MKQLYFVFYMLIITAFSFFANAQSGTLDLTFNPALSANGPIYSTAIQSDGKLIIAGDFTTFNGVESRGIARLHADGGIDGTFDSGTGISGTIRTVQIQNDGRIVISGTFNKYNGVTRYNIARINANGSLDTSFDPGTGANATIYTTSIQSDGKIIIGGDFTTFNGTSKYRIARLNTTGTLDETFGSLLGARNGPVHTTAIQSDGKIILGGGFTTYDGSTRQRIARINADGTLDTSFDTGAASSGGYVYTSAIQSDGKIIVGGYFNGINGTTRNCIARLNANGTLDTSFDPGTGAAGGDVRTAVIQKDGKIIIGGYFDSYNGIAKKRIACLNANGTLDAAYNGMINVESYYVYSATLQSDGKVIVAGNFTDFNGTAIKNIARIIGNTNTSVSLVKTNSTKIYTNPASNITTLELNLEMDQDVSVSIVDLSGRIVEMQNYQLQAGQNKVQLDILELSGIYFVKIATVAGCSTARLIVR